MYRHPTVCWMALALGLLIGSGSQAQPTTLLLSARVAGGGEGDQNSSLPSISANGRYVAFSSRATNLVALDTNSKEDIFLRDLQTGTTTRVSVPTLPGQADAASTHPGISGDGRYIVFESAATNLVPGKGQGIYLRDVQTSQTTFIGTGFAPVISADGSTIAFYSIEALVTADTNLMKDVYVAERSTGNLTLVSVATDGSLGTGDSGVGGIALSSDGSIVAFQSKALNLDPFDTNTGGDIFVRDRGANVTTRVSLGNGDVQSDHGCTAPSISGDGNLVAFESGGTNLVANDTNNSIDVFVRDRTANTTTRVSVGSNGGQIDLDSKHGVLSQDGRFITFETEDPAAIPGKTTNTLDILIRDTQAATTTRVSLSSTDAEIDGASYDTAISADGRYIAFTSEGTNVAPGVTGNVNNVFARGPLVETPGGLAFTQQPAGASAGLPFATQPVVEARNPDGTRRWDFNGAVTLSITDGSGRPGAVLSGTTTVNAVNGVATFSGLSIDKADVGYTLHATSDVLDFADSASFDVLQTPTKVVFTTQPGGAAAGQPFTIQPQIAVQDAESNLVASYTGTATIAIKPTTGRTGAVLSGTLSVPITDGAAAFADLGIDLAGAAYVLTVSSGALTSGDSASFAVAQTPTKLKFSVEVAGAASGMPFATQPAVQVLDAENNLVTAYTGSVSVAIKTGSGRTGAVLSGTVSVNALNGVATFTNLSVNLAGSGYILTATSGTLTSADSGSFTVAQTPTKLAFALQPAGATAGTAFTTQPIALVRDAEDNLVATFTGSVTLTIKTGTGWPGAVLSGTTTVDASSGVASFVGLSIDKASSGYILTASSGTLTAADSSSFTVGQLPFTLADGISALKWAGGLASPDAYDVHIHDAVANGSVDIRDATRIVRKVSGLEPNP